jgi:hypothetical protein
VRESDFIPVEGSIQRPTREPFGFFEYAPGEGVDLDLLDRVLVSARAEVNSVDVVAMPESAIDEGEIPGVEGILARHGVAVLQTGVRRRPRQPGQLGANWILFGVNPELEKGRDPVGDESGEWFHIRQNKHHRWSLDEDQIYQYHLGGALHPHIRWWEATEVPRLSVQFVEVAELTLVSLVCEDLAWNDELAKLIRSVGPTIVVTHLLDGPQLSSRWAARYASVLAEDPGSAVFTLTSYGMVRRSRPHGRDASRVIGLWKDPYRGFREISLEPGAQGVLLTVCMDRATRRSADGRWPLDNGTHAFDASIQQVAAAEKGSGSPSRETKRISRHLLGSEDLTILTGWAEAVAEALAYDPQHVDAVLANARAGAAWRAALGLPDLTSRLREAIDCLARLERAQHQGEEWPTLDVVLKALKEDKPDEERLERVVRRVLLAMLEERRTRRPIPRGDASESSAEALT